MKYCDWKVFLALLETKIDAKETETDMLTKSGFAAAIKSSNEHHIQLLTNDKMVEVAKSVNFDVSEKKEYTETYYYYNVIEKRTEEMRVQY